MRIIPQELTLLRHIHKILPPFRLNAVSRDSHPRDHLDISATSHLPPSLSHVQNLISTRINAYHSILFHPFVCRQYPSTQPTNSSWWPTLTDNAMSLIINVSLTQGKEHNAAAGAPKGNSGYRRDEGFDSHPLSPTRNPNSQQPSIAANTYSGEHRNGLLCSRF
ncbi:hypothetical protein K503DRAFT_806488 [Rhizopogon vinicolor AM-OR11-026]|uniref:Uncharacterized protein n=1 Tax=Rhizopogon vinicolor AM-OR11-026 TaxID=1314800 RepID=A0A1B7MEH0_9AGAM|nr:hypothetical protein K503DRAFT_806488 [Rhizopogon vinicolor AM-OR11-026]